MGLFDLFKKKAVPESVPPVDKNAEPALSNILIRYSYEWNDDVPELERIPCNEFCAKLISLNRFYTRSDIQTMSGKLGYDVFNRKCAGHSEKHQWKSNLVEKK
jgi:hypothetical protein